MDGLLLLGSIGEFFAISTPEKKRLIREALAHIHHRTTVYVGTCEMNLEACVELSNYALEQGADGAMVISPYYFSLPDSAFFLHRPGIFCFYAAQIFQHLCTGCRLHQIAVIPRF